MAWFFWFFFVSGFCSVLCELIWLRLSMAQFGVTTALTSIVLSVFMAGLGVGSWLAGTMLRRYRDRITFSPLRLYAALELMIGVSALVVPTELIWGHRLLESMADRAALASATYDSIAGLCLAATMIPWCACMGATIPVAMFAIRQRQQQSDSRSFSFLYLANVLGAVLGSFLPLLLIEPYGFHKTLHIGAILNVVIAVSAFAVSLASRPLPSQSTKTSAPVYGPTDSHKSILVLLFTTGLATMGMELIWIRLFTPYVGPVVYSFGMILVAYLLATFVGSQIYRYWSRSHQLEKPAHLDLPCTARNAAAAYRRRARPDSPRRARLPRRHALRRHDRIPHSHARRPLGGRRSRPRRTRLCHQRRRMHPRPTHLWIPAAASGRRALGGAAARTAVVRRWRSLVIARSASDRSAERLLMACCCWRWRYCSELKISKPSFRFARCGAIRPPP